MWKLFTKLLVKLIKLVEVITQLTRKKKEVLMARRDSKKIIIEYVPVFDLNSQSGEIDVSTGINDICIETGCKPKKVWFSFDDADDANGGIPVCAGEIDRVGISIMPNGFILHAAITSNSRTIKWNAIL